MVVFKLTGKDNGKLHYIYYPRGIEKEGGGIIEVDETEKTAKIIATAPLDIVREISIKDQMIMRDIVASLREEGGHPELTEDEWPIPNDIMIETHYADCAIKKILDSLKNGEVLELGMARCE